MTTEADALILRYLQGRLEAELRDLPANRRQELLDEVGEHIAAARAALDPETEAGVRTMLERLGDPADIAAEARERFGVQRPPARPATPWLEVIAALAAGDPVRRLGRGGGAGVALAAVDHPRQADRHPRRDELALAGLGAVMTSAPEARERSDRPHWGLGPTWPVGVVLVVAPFVLPIAAAIYLGFRLRAGAAAASAPPS